MNVKKENTFLWRVHAKRVTSVNTIEQHLSMHLFKARTDFSVEPQSILNKHSDNVYLCLLSSFYTILLPIPLLRLKTIKKRISQSDLYVYFRRFNSECFWSKW